MTNLSKALLVILAAVLSGLPAQAFVKPAQEWRVLADVDTRATQEAGALSFAQHAAAARLRAERGWDVTVTVNGVDGTVQAVYGSGVPLGSGSTSAPIASALEFLRTNADLLGVERSVELELGNGRSYVSEGLGLVHVFLARTHQGLPVFQGELRVHVDYHGKVVAASTSGLGPVVAMNDRLLGPAEGMVAAARANGQDIVPVLRKTVPGLWVFHRGPFEEDVTVQAVLFPMQRGQARHAWRVVMHEGGLGNWYETLVDAATGELLYRYNWTRYIQGRVFDEHPDAGARAMRTFPAGWVASNTTIGNNVSAQEDTDANNSGGTRPTMDGSGNFDFPLDLALDPRNYKSAAITNLFYWNNLIHDWWYGLGFNEAAGNFQTNNNGQGGVGNDPVQADAQDGSGTNNANFATPPDGSSGRMQMFLFTSPNPDRDGDYDADVIIHEYGHGLSNRLVGGPSNTSCLNTYQGGGMGEGWGDWFAASYFEDGVMGEYVTQNASTGIRQYNMTNSPLTFQDYKNGRTEVHDSGEIWAATLWDVRKKLVTKYGASSGRTMAEQLVVDGMKLMPCNGGFLPARDAIIQADQNRNAGANKCDLWAAFAARGFGVSAASSTANTTSSVTVAYDVPATCGGIGGAQEVEPNNATSSATSLTNGVAIGGKISTSTDVDFFYMTLGSTGNINVTMTVPASKDYDVQLLNSAGTEVARSELGTGQPETINYNATATGRYYVKVYGYAGAYSATEGYNLKATWPAGTDTTAPTVSITSPTEGATVSGTITVNVSASDNVGVTKVEMWVDSGTPVADVTAPYAFSLNTTTLANGAHTLRAKAYDAAGNTTTTPARNINVQNGGGGGSMNETEPNGSMSSANSIATSGTTVTGYISTSTDLDYFKIVVASGRTVTLTMTVPADKDYDIYLYNSAGTQLGYSIKGTGQTETIIYTNSTGSTQTYYIKVLGYAGAYSTVNPYRLTAQF